MLGHQISIKLFVPDHNQVKGVKPPYPPTMFVHMPRDVRTAQRVRINMELLQNQVGTLGCLIGAPAANSNV